MLKKYMSYEEKLNSEKKSNIDNLVKIEELVKLREELEKEIGSQKTNISLKTIQIKAIVMSIMKMPIDLYKSRL